MLVEQYQAIWTPNLNVVDARKWRMFHAEGWRLPAQFPAMLKPARGQYCLRSEKYPAASRFKAVFDKYPLSIYAPQALCYRGVSRYLSSHKVEGLKADRVLLRRFDPSSPWAIKSNRGY